MCEVIIATLKLQRFLRPLIREGGETSKWKDLRAWEPTLPSVCLLIGKHIDLVLDDIDRVSEAQGVSLEKRV